jgi:hypothetical protein
LTLVIAVGKSPWHWGNTFTEGLMKVQQIGVIAVTGLLFATGYAGFTARAAVHPQASDTIDAARRQIEKGDRAQAKGYAESMLMGQRLLVSVDYGDTPASQIGTCSESLAGAFEMWETALNNDVKFVLARPDEVAAIKVVYDKDVRLDGQIVSGYINWSRTIEREGNQATPIFNADIHLRTTDPSGRQMTATQMRHTAGHELGHMFGLDDVNTVGMLMGPLDLRKPVSKPNPTEIETVQAIRAECQSIVAKAEAPHGHHFLGFGSCDEHHHHH